jgi:hypothetical protein
MRLLEGSIRRVVQCLSRSLLMVVVMAAAAGAAVAAGQGGGASIASAPNLPIGQRIVDGTTAEGSDDGYARLFWRIPLAASDQLRIDYGSTNKTTVNVWLFGPKVTDYTFRSTEPLASDYSSTKREIKYVAPTAGRYTLEVWNSDQLAYELEAAVRHHTTTSLAVPTLLNPNATLPVRGSVTGTSGGRLLLRVAGPHGFKRKAIRPISGSGAFSWTTKVGHAGRYRIRAIYYGDDDHLPSSAARTVRVG